MAFIRVLVLEIFGRMFECHPILAGVLIMIVVGSLLFAFWYLPCTTAYNSGDVDHIFVSDVEVDSQGDIIMMWNVTQDVANDILSSM